MTRIYTYYVSGEHGPEEIEYYEETGPIAEAKGGTQTQVQKSDPWSGQQPYLKQGFEEAQKLFESGGPQYYPGSTVTPYSPQTEQALSMREAQATDPNSLLGRAGAEAERTLRGDYLTPSSPVVQGIMSAVRPGVDSMFARAGRFGSPGHEEALGRGITTGLLPFISAERGRQYDTAMNAPAIAGQIPGVLSEVGAAREAKAGETLADEIARYNFEQTAPQANLQQFLGNISGNYGGTQTLSTPTTSNPLLSTAGGALAGGSIPGAGPAGAIVGGGMGALAGK